MMPYEQNPHFLGRDHHLLHLRHTLQETHPQQYNHRVAIYGMGGVGKTQIAIEYVHRYRNCYQDIYWIHAADQAALLADFNDIGQKTGCLVGKTDLPPMEAAKHVLSLLQMQDNWLLIMDNLDDVTVAHELLPGMQKGRHTIITTRNPNAMDIPATGVKIPLLDEDDAVQLLCIRSGITEAEMEISKSIAIDIVRELGCLPLAIDQAAAFIQASEMVVADFLPIYRESRQLFLLRRPTNEIIYPNSVAITFRLSFDKVASDQVYGSGASQLLKLFAFLNPDGILINFLLAGSPGLSNEIRKVVDQSFIFRESLALLRKFSLVGLSKKRIALSFTDLSKRY